MARYDYNINISLGNQHFLRVMLPVVEYDSEDQHEIIETLKQKFTADEGFQVSITRAPERGWERVYPEGH